MGAAGCAERDGRARGGCLRAILYGRALDFTVSATVPTGAVVFGKDTVVHIDERGTARAGGPRVSYGDIGGLGKEIARVREMIELQLHYPDIFARLGDDAPKRVLLYGPPRCGKTLIARAVAHEAGVRFVSINGPEIIQQGYGESEALLRKIFCEAQESPATIIFFDEIDALAPSCDTVLGDVEKRVVAQLLASPRRVRGASSCRPSLNWHAGWRWVGTLPLPMLAMWMARQSRSTRWAYRTT